MASEKITISIIKADVGSYTGHNRVHPELMQKAGEVAEYMRRHGPFQPHRLPLEEMEYTTLPQIMGRLQDRFRVGKR